MSAARVPAELYDLINEYCSDLIDEAGIRRLEALLLESEAARRFFADYFQHHTEIQFAVRRAGRPMRSWSNSRPGRTNPAAMAGRMGSVQDPTRPGRALRRGDRHHGRGCGRRSRSRPRLGRRSGSRSGGLAAAPVAKAPVANVAWLVNAQDCSWSHTGERPGRNMLAGKSLPSIAGWPRSSSTAGAGHPPGTGRPGAALGELGRLLQGKLTAACRPTRGGSPS